MPKSDPAVGTILLSGILGGALVLLMELVGNGLPTTYLASLGGGLLVSLGVLVALWLYMLQRLVSALGLEGWRRAALHSLAATPLLLLASWRLFEGSHASTILAPEIARILLPGIALALLALLLWLFFQPGLRKLGPWLQRALLIIILFAAHLAAHSELGRGYPDPLVASTALAVVAATLLALSLLNQRWGTARWPLAVAMPLALIAMGTTLWTFYGGEPSQKQRWEVALQHGHASHLVGLARRSFDSDGDGYSSFFGGGDCDDSNPRIHPAAGDIADNGVDENCDGVDALSEAIALPDQAGYEEDIATWLAGEKVGSFLATTAEMDVVVVFVDTLRADVLADTDSNRTDFPHIFALLDQSRRFDFAFSPAAGTDVAMASLLTGRINPFVRIQTTLFEAMNESGRAIYGVFPGEVLRWAGTRLIGRGLTQVAEIKTDRGKPDQGSHSASEETTRAGLRMLEEHEGEGPAFLWLHYFDVHEHLQLPSGTPSIVGYLSPNGDERDERVEKYRATIKFVDQSVGLLSAELRKRGRWDKTIIVLASDHGESMLEDPRLPKAHGLFVYNPLIHVPFAIRIPGVVPAQVKTPVALTDLTPTLTALTGASGLPDTEAHTLLHHLVDDSDAKVASLGWPILLHEQQQWGVIDWPYKLMVRPEDNLKELYDLSRDFAEKRDLSFVNPEKVRALEQLRLQYPPFQVVRTMDIIRQRELIAEKP